MKISYRTKGELISAETVDTVYAPLFWLCKCKPIGRIIGWYISLWEPWLFRK